MKNRTFLRYIVSYALVLMIPFLSVSLIFDQAMVRRYKEELTAGDTHLLTRLQDSLDANLQQLFNLAYVIQNTSSLNPKNIGDDVIARRDAIALLGTYHSILSLPEVILVYRSGDEVCYTGTTAITPQKLFEQQLVYAEHGTEDFFSTIDAADSMVIWPTESVQQYGGQTMDCLTIFLAVGAGNVKPKQRSVFVIPARRMEDQIRTLAGEEIAVLVTDKNGELLLSTGEEELGGAVSGLSGEEIKIAGKTYVHSEIASRITGWVCHVLRPTETLEGPLFAYRSRTAALLGLILALGGILIYFMSWGSYKPIRKLAEKARAYAPGSGTGGEMEQVEAVLESLSEESNAYRSMLENSTDTLRQTCLTRLLAGTDHTEELLAELRGYSSLTDPEELCRVVVMEKKDVSLPAQAVKENLLAVSLEVTDALVCENPPDSDLLAVVLQYGGTASDSDEEIQLFRARLEEESGCPVSLGVSLSVPVTALAEAYRQAVNACRMWLIRGKGSVVFYTPENQVSASLRDYPLQQLEALQWYLLQRDTENVRRCLREIEACLRQEPVSVELARMVCYDAVNMTVRTLMSMQDRVRPEISSDLLESLISFDSVQELTARLEELVESACAAGRNDGEAEQDQRIEAMKQYIRENCFNSEFSLQMAADRFGLTPSNLSHYFKNCTGTGLSEYVQELRRNEACRLLVETEESIQEIGRRVGMVNVSSFIRSFKQQTGLTPGQYRAKNTRK